MASARRKLEAGGEIPHLAYRENPQGRPQPATFARWPIMLATTYATRKRSAKIISGTDVARSQRCNRVTARRYH